MTVEMNMFPLHHHHHQQALHQLAQLQGGGLPLHQPLNLGQQQQEHQQMFQKDQLLQKNHHQFGKPEPATKVSIAMPKHIKISSISTLNPKCIVSSDLRITPFSKLKSSN